MKKLVIALVCLLVLLAAGTIWHAYRPSPPPPVTEHLPVPSPEPKIRYPVAEPPGGVETANSGIDMAKWNDCFDNKKTAAQVDAQMAEGASVGVRGTPGFIINGRLLSGAQPFEAFKNIIDDELASAK